MGILRDKEECCRIDDSHMAGAGTLKRLVGALLRKTESYNTGALHSEIEIAREANKRENS